MRRTAFAIAAHPVPNFPTSPRRGAFDADLTVYHAMPHGLRDGHGRRIVPECFVDVTRVHETKLRALAAHGGQQRWLDASQGLSSYLRVMEDMAREVGVWSRRFRLAASWRRHSHLRFCAEGADPLRDALPKFSHRNKVYARCLEAAVA